MNERKWSKQKKIFVGTIVGALIAVGVLMLLIGINPFLDNIELIASGWSNFDLLQSPLFWGYSESQRTQIIEAAYLAATAARMAIMQAIFITAAIALIYAGFRELINMLLHTRVVVSVRDPPAKI